MTVRIHHFHSRGTKAITDAFERSITQPAMVSSSELPGQQPYIVLFDAFCSNGSKITIVTAMITLTIAALESKEHIKDLDGMISTICPPFPIQVFDMMSV